MKIRVVTYHPLVAKYKKGIPVFWLVKETSYFGFKWRHSLIGRDVDNTQPFQTVDELEEYVKLLDI